MPDRTQTLSVARPQFGLHWDRIVTHRSLQRAPTRNNVIHHIRLHLSAYRISFSPPLYMGSLTDLTARGDLPRTVAIIADRPLKQRDGSAPEMTRGTSRTEDIRRRAVIPAVSRVTGWRSGSLDSTAQTTASSATRELHRAAHALISTVLQAIVFDLSRTTGHAVS